MGEPTFYGCLSYRKTVSINSFHERKELFSRQEIFFFMIRNIYFHENNSEIGLHTSASTHSNTIHLLVILLLLEVI